VIKFDSAKVYYICRLKKPAQTIKISISLDFVVISIAIFINL